jgi:hypothetical protein
MAPLTPLYQADPLRAKEQTLGRGVTASLGRLGAESLRLYLGLTIRSR